jgi:hypothetical protein
MRSVDLIDCQEGRGEIPDFQVGKGEEMNSAREFISARSVDGGGSEMHSDHWGN